jgi:transposase
MLEVDMKTTIMTLYQKGYNKTQIGKMLGIDRKTVRKVLREETQGKELPQETQEGTWPSMLDEYKEYIEIQLSKELSITRIHQDLQKEFGVACGYTTLRDYVKKIRKSQPHAYMVLHSLPGEEAQVDFGYIGTLRVNGTPRKAWIFVMSLSYSRYMYVAVTLDQSVQTFIRCHTEAFRYFGGVPQTVKIDNLKAAIVESDFYEPTVQRTYAAFAEHYGFLPNPCRVYTPTDKGKVESNVKYVKENCFKGRDFKEIEEAKRFLLSWLKETANRRIHGTTSRKPEIVYLETEKTYLKPLPAQDFLFSKSGTATVRTDCHIVYGGNYYSVPYTYIGMDVDVIEVNHLLKIYHAGKEIALHSLCGNVKGEHVTDKSHYPSTKTITQEELLSSYREKMAGVGTGALAFLEAFKDTDMYQCHHYRSISGILALRKKYGEDAVDKACQRACHYGNITYRAVKKICESGLYNLPLEDEQELSMEGRSKIRNLSYYRQMTGLGVISHE